MLSRATVRWLALMAYSVIAFIAIGAGEDTLAVVSALICIAFVIHYSPEKT